MKTLLLGFLCIFLASGCNNPHATPTSTQSLQSNVVAGLGDSSVPASWHTLDLTWPPLRVAFPSGWSVTTFDGETFDIVIRDAAVATEQYQADIKIRRWSLTSTIKDVDAWQAEEQLAAPKHISIGGVPAIEGLGGAQRGPHNENGLPTVEEVLVIAPSGIPYIIDADCIAVYRKEDCEAIIHALHFK